MLCLALPSAIPLTPTTTLGGRYRNPPLQEGKLRHGEPSKPRGTRQLIKCGLFGSAALCLSGPSHALPIPPALLRTGAHVHTLCPGPGVPLPLLGSLVLTTQLKTTSPFLEAPPGSSLLLQPAPRSGWVPRFVGQMNAHCLQRPSCPQVEVRLLSELKGTTGLLSPAPLFRGAEKRRPEMGWVGSEKGYFLLSQGAQVCAE